MFNTPILLLVFNRFESTKIVFEKIKQIKPKLLYISADGARVEKAEEDKICNEVRSWLLENITWDCELKTRFLDTNLGCGKHVSSAISWFFSEVEEGIILEDDCVPDLSFFTFCENLLNKYRYQENVYVIGGNNFQPKPRGNASYYFSAYGHIWGWATWRRAWNKYDFTLQSLNDKTFEQQLNHYFEEQQILDYWMRIYKLMKYKPIDTWDYQWTICQWYHNGINIVPNVNLVSNIGFDKNATHTTSVLDKVANLPTKAIPVITHPSKISINRTADLFTFYNNFEVKWKQNTLGKKIKDKLIYEWKKLSGQLK